MSNALLNKPRVLWSPNSDVQRAFLASSARTTMMGGGAGSGKSSALLAAATLQIANPKHRAVIFRRDYPSLKHIVSASYALFLPLRASYNKSEHCWTFPRGSTIEFSHLEDETAMYQHAGKEYSFIGFDELQQLPADSVDSKGQPINSAFSYMRTRLRAAKDSNLRLEIRCTATPGGVGMAWVKSYFRIPDNGESTEFIDEVTGFRRAYFKATVADNPALAGTDYERQLLDLPAAQMKAYLHGDWSSYAGQIFTEFSREKHLCDAFPLPETWRKWRGADDGFAAPFACLWLAWDRDGTDTIYVTHELYQRQLTPEAVAEKLKATDGFLGGGRWRGVLDCAAFANTGASGEGSRGQQMNKAGCKFMPATKGADSICHGLNAIHTRLELRADGSPGLRIFKERCPNLIRELSSLVYDARHVEEYDSACEDHSISALRYGLLSRPAIGYMKRIF